MPTVLPPKLRLSSVPPQALDASTVVKSPFPRVWMVHDTALNSLVDHLVPAFLLGDTTFIHSFLLTYIAVASTQQVLDEFFNR